MKNKYRNLNKSFRLSVVARAIALSAIGGVLTVPALAEQTQGSAVSEIDEIIVTATRRTSSVQDVPINIAALGSERLEQQGFGDIAEVLQFVPGINAIDQGGRNGNVLIVRGLNADPLGQGDTNGTGGTVASYIGEIPLTIDLRVTDLERIEVLLGPQGTLYGAGTLGGAIRYIPKKPNFEETEFSMRGDLFKRAESDDFGTDLGATINIPLSENAALRASVDRYDDPGFIDQPFVVRQIGVSEPDSPRGSSELNPSEDVNGQESLTSKVALRWMPSDTVDTILSYYSQSEDNEGRTISSRRGQLPTGPYENAQRVLEPNEEKTDLLALEVIADLGFAELTSATGLSEFKEVGQRDQTDLLISLEYSYETFPTFTAFTREEEREDVFNQEIRVVSTNDSALNWIVGGFYNKLENVDLSAEFTPGYAQFAGFDRPDNLEYFSTSSTETVEQAIFGELGYQINSQWQVTLGGRYYEYEINSQQTVDFPLFDPGFVAVGLDTIEDRAFDPTLNQEDNGTLFKFNTSYAVNDDINLYLTVSEGFRIGGVNGGGPCPDFDSNTVQGNCNLAPGQQFGPGPNDFAQFDERSYGPDTTRNHELGFKTRWLDGHLTLNGAVFYVEWSDNQLSSATVNASVPITINANGAESKGLEATFDWLVSDALRLQGSFSHTASQLSAGVPSLINTISSPGFSTRFEDGRSGDRLPGSPETQASLLGTYTRDLAGGAQLIVNGSYAWQSDILSRTGALGSSFTLPSFGVANVSATYQRKQWGITGYVNNLFDEYAETGVQSTRLSNQTVNGATVRSFVVNVLNPLTAGVRFKYRF